MLYRITKLYVKKKNSEIDILHFLFFILQVYRSINLIRVTHIEFNF